MNNERLLRLAEKYGIELAKEVLREENGFQEDAPENETIAKMISDGTKEIVEKNKTKNY